MIAICDNHSPHTMGVRYDPTLAPRERCRCSLCGGELRAKRPGESVPNVITAKVLREVPHA